MNITDHNTHPAIDVSGTCLQTSLENVTYAELLEFFGTPQHNDIGTSDEIIEWNIRFRNFRDQMVVASIYRYVRMGSADVVNVKVWSVGAKDLMTALEVYDVIAYLRGKRHAA